MPGQLKTRILKAKLKDFGIDQALELVAEGLSLSKVADKVGVSRHIVSTVLNKPEHVEKLREARKLSASVLADGCLDIAEQADPLTEKVAKLNIATRQWLASKYDKEQFGDTQNQVNISVGSLLIEALRTTQAITPTASLNTSLLNDGVTRARHNALLSAPCEQVTTTEASEGDSKQQH